MKKLLLNLVVLFALLCGAAIFYPLYFGKVVSRCDRPLGYSTGSVDPKFGYSDEKFITASKEAAAIWNKAIGKQLLAYEAGATLSVNLVYDERQSLLSSIQDLEGDVSRDKESVDKEAEAFDVRVSEFEKKVEKLNEEIENWNKQGGAPPVEYERLSSEQSTMGQEAAKLNEEAKKFNKKVGGYNTEVKNLNKQISNFNEALHDKPEGGLYMGDSNRIEVYLASDRNELVRILAHEMGHAMGIGHVADPNSIMYPLSLTAQKLTKDDISALNDICRGEKNWKILTNRFQNNIQYLLAKYSAN